MTAFEAALLIKPPAMPGVSDFFFSTDYPHADCSFPHATEKFLALEGIDAASKRKILWDNPARMYNL